MLPFNIFITLICTFHLKVVTGSFWSIPSYFSNCNIQFVKWTKSIGQMEDYYSYFYDIMISNPNSPLMLNQIEINVTHVTVLRPGNSFMRRHTRSGRTPVAFFSIGHAMLGRQTYGNGRSIYYYIRDALIKNFNPTYIFQHTNEPLNPINFKDYLRHIGGTKLVLFSLSSPGKMFLPCITCIASPTVTVSTIPFREIDGVWWSENKNLQQSKMLLQEDYNFDGMNCRVNYVPGKSTILRYCKIKHLSQNLNF